MCDWITHLLPGDQQGRVSDSKEKHDREIEAFRCGMDGEAVLVGGFPNSRALKTISASGRQLSCGEDCRQPAPAAEDREQQTNQAPEAHKANQTDCKQTNEENNFQR